MTMPSIDIRLEGDGSFQDIADKIIPCGAQLRIAYLPAGMGSGKASIAIGIPLPDGRWAFAETSYALFESTARALAARNERAPA